MLGVIVLYLIIKFEALIIGFLRLVLLSDFTEELLSKIAHLESVCPYKFI